MVYDLAAEVTAGATTDYDRVIALQNWFQTFEYSTEVQSGHGSNAIENFLQIRNGYCEQFAATFAAMARTLGIPSRVAVGYTPGRCAIDGWYSVLGKNSHAWPEIWFDGIGWVPFEPTPLARHPRRRELHGCRRRAGHVAGRVDGQRSRRGRAAPATPTTVFAPPTTLRPRTDVQDPDARPTGAAPGTSAAAPEPSGELAASRGCCW